MKIEIKTVKQIIIEQDDMRELRAVIKLIGNLSTVEKQRFGILHSEESKLVTDFHNKINDLLEDY